MTEDDPWSVRWKNFALHLCGAAMLGFVIGRAPDVFVLRWTLAALCTATPARRSHRRARREPWITCREHGPAGRRLAG
jgi:hypothetical protein